MDEGGRKEETREVVGLAGVRTTRPVVEDLFALLRETFSLRREAKTSASSGSSSASMLRMVENKADFLWFFSSEHIGDEKKERIIR